MPPKKVFAKCKFCFSGALSQTRTKMQAKVVKLGATTGTTCSKSVTHLVTTPAEVASVTAKVANAQKYGIPIVGEAFLDDCIAAGKLVSVNPYLLDGGGDGAAGAADYDSEDEEEEAELAGGAGGGGVFGGNQICVSGSGFKRTTAALKKLLRNNGAVVCSSTSDPVYVIVAAREPASNPNNKPVVNEKWVNDALLTGKMPPTSQAKYHLGAKGKRPRDDDDDDDDEDDEPPAKKAKRKAPAKKKASKQSGVAALTKAAFDGDLAEFDKLLYDGVDVNGKNDRGQTALYCGARNGFIAIVTSALQSGADASITDNNKSTPLHAAAFYGHQDVCEALLTEPDTTADALAKNKFGNTPIHEAADEGHDDIAEYLFAEGLTTAAFKGETARVKEFLKLPVAGDNINCLNARGQTALYCAAREGHAAIIRELVKAGADTSLTDSNHSTPLHAAAFFGHAAAAQALVEAKADTQAKNKFNMTPIQEADAANNHAIKTLLTNHHNNMIAAAALNAASTSASSTTTTTTPTTTATPAAPAAAAGGSADADAPVDNSHLCVVCIDEAAVMACYPCGHRCLCKEDAEAIKKSTKKCPMCNQKMKDVIHVYMT